MSTSLKMAAAAAIIWTIFIYVTGPDVMKWLFMDIRFGLIPDYDKALNFWCAGLVIILGLWGLFRKHIDAKFKG